MSFRCTEVFPDGPSNLDLARVQSKGLGVHGPGPRPRPNGGISCPSRGPPAHHEPSQLDQVTVSKPTCHPALKGPGHVATLGLATEPPQFLPANEQVPQLTETHERTAAKAGARIHRPELSPP